ncbi:MFS transporter [Sorangium sp. So ce131]|uniref:MFS transporter n=1 Tax=Sorangium sp. So ce131 TaxID=3133282 RepID=UPI003F5DE501
MSSELTEPLPRVVRGPRRAPLARWAAIRHGAVATAALAALIVAGSRDLADFDSALVGYTFACLFMTFGVVYRYSVWLSKPPTRKYWVRGFQVLFSPRRWPRLRRPTLIVRALWSKIIAQDFILRRGATRWIAHMLIAWGCTLAAAVTFPLVFGWLHFESGAAGADSARATYRVVLFGQPVSEIPVHGAVGWTIFHALIVSGFMVVPGVMLAMIRRMRERGAVAVQRFERDLLPLLLLFAVSVSGLLLWVSYEWLHGYFYGALAQLHALTVIVTLLYLPFGKLFHVFQRPASVGVTFYKEAGDRGEKAVCPVTGEAFAAKLQTDDLEEVLGEVGFDYAPRAGTGPAWSELSPRGRRMLIGRAHSRARRGRFS